MIRFHLTQKFKLSRPRCPSCHVWKSWGGLPFICSLINISKEEVHMCFWCCVSAAWDSVVTLTDQAKRAAEKNWTEGLISFFPYNSRWSISCWVIAPMSGSPLCFFAVVGVVDVMHGWPERTINGSFCAGQTKLASTGGELCTNALNCPSWRLSIHTTGVYRYVGELIFYLAQKVKVNAVCLMLLLLPQSSPEMSPFTTLFYIQLSDGAFMDTSWSAQIILSLCVSSNAVKLTRIQCWVTTVYINVSTPRECLLFTAAVGL